MSRDTNSNQPSTTASQSRVSGSNAVGLEGDHRRQYHSPLPTRQLIQYGLLAMPLAFAGIPIYIHLPELYVSEYGVALSAMGVILLLIRLFDAVQDPLIGYWSDRYEQHRLTIMLVGGGMLVAGFGLMFQPLIESALLWFGLTLLIATTGFSIVTINLQALGTLWESSEAEKTRIASYRERWGLLGLLLATLLPSVLMLTLTPVTSFQIVAGVLLLLMAVGFWGFIGWWRSEQPSCSQSLQSSSRRSSGAAVGATEGQHAIEKGRAAAHDKPPARGHHLLKAYRELPTATKTLYPIYAVSMIASSIPAVLVLFFINDRLQLESYTGLFLSIYFLSAACGMTLWERISQRWGKVKAWGLAMVIASVALVWAFFLGAGDWIPYAVICLVSGIALGAELVLPISILADQLADSESVRSEEAGANTHGSFACSLLTLITKMTMAIAAAVALPLLQWAGYEPNLSTDAASLFWLSLIYGVVPVVLKLAALLLLKLFGEQLYSEQ